MENFEQRVVSAVNEKLNDGTVEKLIEQYIEKGVQDALDSIFSYSGKGREILKEKLDGTIVPVIEEHDFNKYLTKLDTVLTEIINTTNLADNKKILKRFAGLMKEPDMEEIKLSEVFRQYCLHVSQNVDTDDLEACCEDGEPYYEHVAAQMEVEYEEKGWFKSSYDDCIVKLICDEDDNLNCQIKLYKCSGDEKWKILRYDDSVDINSLRGLSDFEVFLMTLKRAFVKIVIDKENGYDDDIEPEEKPEYSLS